MELSLNVFWYDKRCDGEFDTAGSEEKIRVFPTGVEPMTTFLLVQIA